MALPADNYTVASGQSFYIGMAAPGGGLPAWVPEPGMLKSVHMNDLAALNPCPGDQCWYSQASKQNGPWEQWGGAVFMPHYSENGAMAYWAGGHGGADGIEVVIHDLTPRHWKYAGPPTPPFDFISSDYIDPVWCDYFDGENHIPPASHTYASPRYLPPEFGGGPKGSLLFPFNVFGKLSNGAGQSYASHRFDGATEKWSRFGGNTYEPSLGNGPYGACFIDTKRGVLWGMQGHDSNQNAKMSLLGDKLWTPVTSFWNPGYYFIPQYIEHQDLLVCADINGTGHTVRIFLYDMSTGTPVGLGVVAQTNGPVLHSFLDASKAAQGSGFDYCEHTGKFYLYTGYGDTNVHVATPPAGNWRTGTWGWAVETMGGEAPVARLGAGSQPFTKWAYNPALKSFMWSAGTESRQSPDGVMRSGAFQLYRPQGT